VEGWAELACRPTGSSMEPNEVRALMEDLIARRLMASAHIARLG
jgi:hypothetical protein